MVIFDDLLIETQGVIVASGELLLDCICDWWRGRWRKEGVLGWGRGILQYLIFVSGVSSGDTGILVLSMAIELT